MTARWLTLLVLTAAIGGCGDGGATPGKAVVQSRGVIVSSADCVSFGPDAVASCSAAIEKAVTAHEASSTSYSNIAACETAVGRDNCERSASGKYRIQLSAFMVTLGSSAYAEPLYPVKDGSVAFQTADQSKLLASDTGLAFSRLALSVAETQAGSGKNRASKSPF